MKRGRSQGIDKKENNSKILEKEKKTVKKNLIKPKIKLCISDNEKPKISDLSKINCEIIDDMDEIDLFLCNKISKNIKLLLSINLRKKILSLKWLTDSYSNNKALPYEDYYVKDRESEKKYDFILSDIFKTSHANYLKDFSFFVTEHVLPNKDDIEELIKSANGNIIENIKKIKDDTIIIADKNNDREFIKHYKNKKAKIYSVDLLLESVFKQEMDLNKLKYKL